MGRHFRLAALFAVALGAAAMPAIAATPVGAATPSVAAASAEPPMWVARDADSTVYLFGTVHLLDPAIQWRTPRVLKALEEARQLWVEVDIPPGGEMALAMTMLQRAMSPGQPLSSRLNEEERAQLKKLLARSPDAAALGAAIEMTKPWFATVMLGVAPLMSAGYEAEAGADAVLTKLAREQGDEVRGLETAEQQIDWIAAGTDEEQLATLKKVLATPESEFDEMTRTMDEGVRAWMKGDVAPLTEYVESWRKGEEGPSTAGMSYQQLIVNRNENWAGQLEELMKGSGVAFVAVGSGHLVGPDSLQARLRVRGISVTTH